MRIAFLSLSPQLNFNVETPLHQPLGGTESTACHLAAALARRGHDVFLLSNTSNPGSYQGVQCVRWDHSPEKLLQVRAEVAVVLRVAGKLQVVRSILGPKVGLVLWAADDPMQTSIKPLLQPAERNAVDGLVSMSYWQREQYHLHLRYDQSKTQPIRNVLSPAFEALFPPGEPILPAKSWPPVLAYTSTPFRGLSILLDILPAVRAALPGTRLKVFSSMKVYQMAPAEEEALFGALYKRCVETEGVEYVGSLPQPELARQMREVMGWSYTNTFAETGCISAVEAMAAGCRIVTTDLGALPETTAGFADLVPAPAKPAEVEVYKARYTERLVAALQACRGDQEAAQRGETGPSEQLLRRQVAYACSAHHADLQARAWEHYLAKVVTAKRPS